MDTNASKVRAYLRSILSKNLRRIDIKEVVFTTGLSHDEVLKALDDITRESSN